MEECIGLLPGLLGLKKVPAQVSFCSEVNKTVSNTRPVVSKGKTFSCSVILTFIAFSYFNCKKGSFVPTSGKDFFLLTWFTVYFKRLLLCTVILWHTGINTWDLRKFTQGNNSCGRIWHWLLIINKGTDWSTGHDWQVVPKLIDIDALHWDLLSLLQQKHDFSLDFSQHVSSSGCSEMLV